ncbi:hypothetical protein [Paraburkholderia sp. GAS334]|uniref:hypothetical protein n=1 Tax=Paraburkholderia sp. GAS334 TaxID=3035131 RepID=UPI003D1B5164
MDEITRKWFDFDNVSVKFDGAASSIEEWISGREIAKLTGAPKGSEITVSTDEQAIRFQVENEIFQGAMWRYLIQNADDTYSFHIQNRVLDLKEEFSNQGIGPRCVIHEIFGASDLAKAGTVQITRIEAWAVGNIRSFYDSKYPMRGYYVWPSMGFDAAIPATVAPKLEQKFKKCNRIIELVDTEEGLNQWLEHGDEVMVSFDLGLDSPSWKRLGVYMQERGIEL